MKLRLTLKSPDAIRHSICEAAENNGMEEDEVAELLEPWIHFGEYVYVDIDTELGTAAVVTR